MAQDADEATSALIAQLLSEENPYDEDGELAWGNDSEGLLDDDEDEDDEELDDDGRRRRRKGKTRKARGGGTRQIPLRVYPLDVDFVLVW